MINVTLEYVDPTEDRWMKAVVIQQPSVGEFIRSSGLLWRVARVEHSTSDPAFKATVEGEVTGNIHWELGHERGWTLMDSAAI